MSFFLFPFFFSRAGRRTEEEYKNRAQEQTKQNMNPLCKVCGDPAAGYHFGAFTCEGCKVRRDHLNSQYLYCFCAS